MTNKLFCLLLFMAWMLSSCHPLDADLSLDDLEDKQEITGTLFVDVSHFKGSKVERLQINGYGRTTREALSLNHPGFYRLEIFTEGADGPAPDVIRIVLLDKERGEPEWGLNKWTPVPPLIAQIDERNVSLIYPARAPAGISIPLIVKLEGDPANYPQAYVAKSGSGEFYIKRGIGSAMISPEKTGEGMLSIDHRSFPVQVHGFNAAPLLLQGQLASDLYIEAGSYVKIEEDLIIPPGVTLTIEEGVFLSISPEVNLYNEGILRISGSEEMPVTFTCSEAESHWGGIISTGAGNQIEATFAIFALSGFHTEGIYRYGHAGRQALIYSEDALLDFDHCYMIDHAGQVFYPLRSTLNISHTLVQRAMTGGQVNDSELILQNSIFTDFPDDSQNYQDQDNDALYLMGSNAVITKTYFMYAKDDGLDSGGSSGGRIEVINSHFEAIFHEGAALSSGGSATKHHYFSGCTFSNCGQGLELGYSSPNHLVEVDSCFFGYNGIGIRYGDNYTSPHRGRMLISNSQSLFNADYDVWNMLRENWSADTFKMEFNHVMVSMETPMYPDLVLYEAN